MDRYAVLMTFTIEEELGTKKIAEQWGANRQGVMGMVGQARTNPAIYEELKKRGYTDPEFPDWWYSPGRPTQTEPVRTQSKIVSTQLKTDDASSEVVEPSSTQKESDEIVAPQSITSVTTVPIEAGRGRPPLPELDYTELASTEENQFEPSSTIEGLSSTTEGLNENRIRLLNDHSITRGPDGVWVHLEVEPSGRKIITPVNPMAKLQRLSRQSQGDAILQQVNKNMIEQLEISTRAREFLLA